jgi:hypothetical protein
VVYVLSPEGEPLDGTRQGLPFFSVGQASESSLTPVPVILGVSANGYSEVLSGDLKEGDLVVLNPPE